MGDGAFTVFPDYFMAGDDTTDGMVVTFTPDAEGIAEATLVISSNDPTSPDLLIQLSGEGFTEGTSGSGGDSVSSGVVNGCGCATTNGGGAGGLALVTGVLLVGATRRRDGRGG